jgi:flagellar basal-body rod modification protein FlgD
MAPSIPSSSSTPSTGATSNSSGSPSSSSSSSSNTVNEDTFLQLLVSELQNQDPTNPTDSTEFVTQLAEFQQLTTSMNMATTVSNIQTDTDQLVQIAGGTPAGNSQTSTSGTSGTQS